MIKPIIDELPRRAVASVTSAEVKVRKTKVRIEVPVHLKDAVTYAEAEALGFGSERKLRELIAAGAIKRAVLRVGRSVKLLRAILIEELQELED